MKFATRRDYIRELINRAFDGRLPAVGGNPNTNNTATCLYRTNDGKACVAGILIPDEKYEARFEGHTVKELPEGVLTLPPDVSFALLKKIQEKHDYQAFNKDLTRTVCFSQRFIGSLLSIDEIEDDVIFVLETP